MKYKMEKYSKKILVDFEPISRRIPLSLNKNFYELLIKNGIQITSICGGLGTCGKCKILIQKGLKFLNAPTDFERKIFSKNELESGWRLACQTIPKKENIQEIKKNRPPQFRIFLPDELLVEDFKILTAGTHKKVNINPAIKKIFVSVKKPSLEEPIPDFERVINSLENASNNLYLIEKSVLKELPNILRINNHEITIAIWNDKKIIACEPGNTSKDNYGIAFDIGTTTIVGYLINLNDGKIYSITSKLNPQTAFGEDVITRITFIKDNENGLTQLNSLVIKALNDIILRNCEKAHIHPSQIYEITIVGNSVMHHIFLNINPINIGISPYVPVIQQALNFKARDLNLNVAQEGNVYVLPTIAGFVGADTMGVIIASNIENERDLTLVIDIGTNGEIVIGNQDIIATGSCAAGSALEGAHIKFGMRAASGSIDSVKIDPKTLNVSYTTIKNKKPIGICGSGLIDIVAEMLKAKIIARSGTFNKKLLKHNRFRTNGKNIEFIIAKKEDTASNNNITISQEDIRQIQMAKAAFFAGTNLILKYLKENGEISDLKIKQIFLAGAFGNYINKENAKFIGMIPDINSEKIFQIGNAAGSGAQICLINKDFRKKTKILLSKTKYVEISTQKQFQKEYAEAMYFPHMKLELFPNLIEYDDIPLR